MAHRPRLRVGPRPARVLSAHGAPSSSRRHHQSAPDRAMPRPPSAFSAPLRECPLAVPPLRLCARSSLQRPHPDHVQRQRPRVVVVHRNPAPGAPRTKSSENSCHASVRRNRRSADRDANVSPPPQHVQRRHQPARRLVRLPARRQQVRRAVPPGAQRRTDPRTACPTPPVGRRHPQRRAVRRRLVPHRQVRKVSPLLRLEVGESSVQRLLVQITRPPGQRSPLHRRTPTPTVDPPCVNGTMAPASGNGKAGR